VKKDDDRKMKQSRVISVFGKNKKAKERRQGEFPCFLLTKKTETGTNKKEKHADCMPFFFDG